MEDSKGTQKKTKRLLDMGNLTLRYVTTILDHIHKNILRIYDLKKQFN